MEPVDSEMETVFQELVQETSDAEWQKVETKKTKKKKKKKGPKKKVQTKKQNRPLRPCALVGKTYMLMSLARSKDTTLQNVGLAVAGVRKTLSGDILLILNKDNQGKATEIGQKISTVLGEDATINARIQEITLALTRLDGTTTNDEVYQVVMRELGNGHIFAPETLVSVRMTYGGMQTALLKLPAQAAKKLLEKQTYGYEKPSGLPSASNAGNMATSRINVPRRLTDLNAASSSAKKTTKRRSVWLHYVAISAKRQAIS